VINTRDASDALALAAVNESDLIHVVSCLDLLSLRRAQWTLKRMGQFGLARDLIRLVISRYEKNPHISLEEAEKILDLKIAWTIPADPRAVNDALNEGIPFVHRNRNGLHSCFETYAGRVVDGEAPAPAAADRRGLRRLFSGRARRLS